MSAYDRGAAGTSGVGHQPTTGLASSDSGQAVCGKAPIRRGERASSQLRRNAPISEDSGRSLGGCGLEVQAAYFEFQRADPLSARVFLIFIAVSFLGWFTPRCPDDDLNIDAQRLCCYHTALAASHRTVVEITSRSPRRPRRTSGPHPAAADRDARAQPLARRRIPWLGLSRGGRWRWARRRLFRRSLRFYVHEASFAANWVAVRHPRPTVWATRPIQPSSCSSCS
jgi:hypothetical protein